MPRILIEKDGIRIVRCYNGCGGYFSVAEAAKTDAMGALSWSLCFSSLTNNEGHRIAKILDAVSSMVPIDDTDDKPEKRTCSPCK